MSDLCPPEGLGGEVVASPPGSGKVAAESCQTGPQRLCLNQERVEHRGRQVGVGRGARRQQAGADFLRDWLGGEAEQASFAVRFAELTAGLRPSLVFWSLLHDADERNPTMLGGLFTHVGFRSHDGSRTRPSFALWLDRWAPD